MEATISYRPDEFNDRTSISVEPDGAGTIEDAEAAVVAKALLMSGDSPRGTVTAAMATAIVMKQGSSRDAYLTFAENADPTNVFSVSVPNMHNSYKLTGSKKGVNIANADVAAFAAAYLAARGLTGNWSLVSGRFV